VAVAQDKWVHVVAVYSGKVVEHYVDGLKIAAYALDGKVVGKDCRFAIGARGVGCGKIWQILPGMVDEIFVLRRALEAEEVASLAMGNWKGGCQAAIKCSDLAQCDDANNCTDDSCDPKTGNCLHTLKAIGAPCDDGNPCTTPDTCKETSCVSGPAMKCAAGTTCKLGKCE
jgi:hypothetical protein